MGFIWRSFTLVFAVGRFFSSWHLKLITFLAKSFYVRLVNEDVLNKFYINPGLSGFVKTSEQ